MALIIVELNEDEVKDLKAVRNYFGEHDVSMFEHKAYSVLDRLLNKFTGNNKNHSSMWCNLILNDVSNKTGIPIEYIKGKSQEKDITEVRHLFIYFAKNKTGLSFSKIGKYINRKTSNCITNYHKMSDRISVDKRFVKKLNDIGLGGYLKR